MAFVSGNRTPSNSRSTKETNLSSCGSDNNITALPSGFASSAGKLPSLQHLALDQNSISSIPEGFLSATPKITMIRLGRNNLHGELSQSFLSTLATLEHLSTLELGGNAFNGSGTALLHNILKGDVLKIIWIQDTRIDFKDALEAPSLLATQSSLLSVNIKSNMSINGVEPKPWPTFPFADSVFTVDNPELVAGASEQNFSASFRV